MDVVQCQRTRIYISQSKGGVTWTCTHCAEEETYRRLGAGEFGHDVVTAAIAMCREEFELEDDGVPTVVWLGDHPETVFEALLGTYHIYLGRESNQWQLMYSGAHEAFHRVCTPNNTVHWAHEMLAVLFSLFFLDRIGQTPHADANRGALAREAQQCSAYQLFAQTSLPFPAGLYGRAYVVGEQLKAVIGWDLLKSLAVARNVEGEPDPDAWLGSLPARERVQARAVLTAPIAPPE